MYCHHNHISPQRSTNGHRPYLYKKPLPSTLHAAIATMLLVDRIDGTDWENLYRLMSRILATVDRPAEVIQIHFF